MGHGGKREGAGKPKSAKNKRQAEALAKAEATGETPADILLRLARDAAAEYDAVMKANPIEDMEEGNADALKTLQEVRKTARLGAKACAEAAAPYFNPRLSNVDLGQMGPIEVVVKKFERRKRAPA